MRRYIKIFVKSISWRKYRLKYTSTKRSDSVFTNYTSYIEIRATNYRQCGIAANSSKTASICISWFITDVHRGLIRHWLSDLLFCFCWLYMLFVLFFHAAKTKINNYLSNIFNCIRSVKLQPVKIGIYTKIKYILII